VITVDKVALQAKLVEYREEQRKVRVELDSYLTGGCRLEAGPAGQSMVYITDAQIARLKSEMRAWQDAIDVAMTHLGGGDACCLGGWR
jgi:hypothetical protein